MSLYPILTNDFATICNLCTNYLAPIMVVNRGLLFSCSWNGFLKNGFQMVSLKQTISKCVSLKCSLGNGSLQWNALGIWSQSIFDSSRNNCTMYCHSSSFPMNDQIEHNKCPCGG